MTTNSGLNKIIAGDTKICLVEEQGAGLYYRGFAIDELASKATFEEVVYLLLYNKLPNGAELSEFNSKFINKNYLTPQLCLLLEQVADAHAMDVLRLAVDFSAASNKLPGKENMAIKVIPLVVQAVLYWYHYHNSGTKIKILTSTSSIAELFLKMLHQKTVTKEKITALQQSLILYAEHEFNASTFAARVATSTNTDCYSALISAIATLKGPLHGGANEHILQLTNSVKSPTEAEQKIIELLTKKQLIMGFGHRVYKKRDPRSTILKKLAESLCNSASLKNSFAIFSTIEETVWQHKKLPANLDFYSAFIYRALDIPNVLFTPLFAIARISGWTAHIIEQQQCNKLIRPMANYVGPSPKPFVNIEERD